jgi:ATP phosphoribosyltransferase regulatory subunit
MMDKNDRDLLPEGLEDRLPQATAAATRITRAIMDVLDSHGFDRVQPPSIEFERSLASRMAGIETRRMVRFIDPSSLRMMALRSDMTPQVGRLAATRLKSAARPLRLAYAGQVVTLKGDGLDPTRERLQIGAELIGHDGAAAAGEVVAVAIEALQAAGASGISVDFTLPDLIDALAGKDGAQGPWPLTPEQLEAVRRELDAKDAGGLVGAGGTAYLPLLHATGELEASIARLEALGLGEVLSGRIAALRQIAARLPATVRLTLDPTERHGFEYQSWFGFQIFASGVQGAVARGGSYAILGAPNEAGEAATGFSLYPDPLITALAAGETPRDVVFLPQGHDAQAAARLRAAGWRTVAALGDCCDAAALGCTHRLDGAEPVRL